MTVVSDFFFTLRSIEDGPKCDHYRRYTASNSEPIFHNPPAASRSKASSFFFGPCEAIQAQQQLGGRSFSPLLVPAGAEFNGGAGADVVGGGGQTRDTYNDDFLDILEPDADKQLK